MYKSVFTLALLLAMSATWAKGGIEKSKKVQESFTVGANSMTTFKSSDTQVDIQTWDGKSIEVTVNIIVRAEDEASALEFLDAASPQFTSKANEVGIDLTLCGMSWEKNNGKSKVKIDGGKWIKILDFKLEAIIKIPRDGNLDLNASYGRVKMSDLGGNATICGYDGEIRGGHIAGKAAIKMTYGKLILGNIGAVESLKLYESTFTVANLPACTFTSHYSTINIDKAGNLTVDSYEDKLTFGSTGQIDGKFTYSTVNAGAIGPVNLDLYESKLAVGSIGKMNIESHYSRLEIGKCPSFHAQKCYEDDCTFAELGELTGKGQYVKFDIGKLTGNVVYEGYEGKVDIKSTTGKVQRVEIGGKYMQVYVMVDQSRGYTLQVDVQYPSLSYPKTDFKSSVTSQSDKVQFALKDHVAGKSSLDLVFSGYEMSIDVEH